MSVADGNHCSHSTIDESHRLAVSMIWASHPRHMMDSKPLASSGEILSVFGPL